MIEVASGPLWAIDPSKFAKNRCLEDVERRQMQHNIQHDAVIHRCVSDSEVHVASDPFHGSGTIRAQTNVRLCCMLCDGLTAETAPVHLHRS